MATSSQSLRGSLSIVSGVALTLAVSLAGCSSTEGIMPRVRSLGVYRVDVNQGNYLTKDQIERLRPGQTRAQVRTLLGSPLVTSAFHANRWDYVYELKLQGSVAEHRRFAVFFADEKLARWEGDEMPVSAAVINRTVAEAGVTQSDDRSGFFDWVRGIFGRR